jgi:hypothetical protein
MDRACGKAISFISRAERDREVEGEGFSNKEKLFHEGVAWSK